MLREQERLRVKNQTLATRNKFMIIEHVDNEFKNNPKVYYKYYGSDMLRAKSVNEFERLIITGAYKVDVNLSIRTLLMGTKREGMEELLKFMTESQFFILPASLRYHQNWAGGLAEHSLSVTCNLIRLSQLGLLKANLESIIICGILHDLCKVDNYIQLLNKSFGRNPNSVPGHASKSIKYIEKYITLTDEEKQAIRFHMGAYNQKDIAEHWNSMAQSYKEYSISYWLHVADMMDTYNF